MEIAEIPAGDSAVSVHGADQPGSVGGVRERLLTPGRMDGMPIAALRAIGLQGFAIVTSPQRGRGAVGLTMSAVTPLSLAPPMFLICLDLASGTLLAIEASKSSRSISSGGTAPHV